MACIFGHKCYPKKHWYGFCSLLSVAKRTQVCIKWAEHMAIAHITYTRTHPRKATNININTK